MRAIRDDHRPAPGAPTGALIELIAPFSWLIAVGVVVLAPVAVLVVLVLSPLLVPLAVFAVALRWRHHRVALEAERDATEREAWLRGVDLWRATNSLEEFAHECFTTLGLHIDRLEAWREGSQGVQDPLVLAAREERVEALEHQTRAQADLAAAAWLAWMTAYWGARGTQAERRLRPVLDKADALARSSDQTRAAWEALARDARLTAAALEEGDRAPAEPTAPEWAWFALEATDGGARATAEGRGSIAALAQRAVSVAEGCEFQAQCLADQEIFEGSSDFQDQLGRIVDGLDAARRFDTLSDHLGRLDLLIQAQAELDGDERQIARLQAQRRTLEEIAAL